jgi:hypothetical protein
MKYVSVAGPRCLSRIPHWDFFSQSRIHQQQKRGVKNIKLVVPPVSIHKYNDIANYLIFINKYKKRSVSTDKENKYF